MYEWKSLTIVKAPVNTIYTFLLLSVTVAMATTESRKIESSSLPRSFSKKSKARKFTKENRRLTGTRFDGFVGSPMLALAT